MNKKKKDLVVKKERLVSISIDIKFIIKLIFVCLVILGFWSLLYFDHLDIYIHKTSKYKYYLFMTLVSILTLISTMTIGLWFGNLGKWFKIIVFLMVLYFAYLGYQYIGVGINFKTNYGLLHYTRFETNSYRGVRFFIENVFLIIILYFISLPFESEK